MLPTLLNPPRPWGGGGGDLAFGIHLGLRLKKYVTRRLLSTLLSFSVPLHFHMSSED